MQKTHSEFIGQSPNFLSVLEKASCLRGRNANVLITGKSGTGKELLAKYIHHLEGEPSRPFVAVNCAAIPENLLESELFGYEKGAFTGATELKIGKFELADGGDIFLDEVSTLTPALQAKLLRVLQDKIIHRLGGKSPIHLNFRVITATNEVLTDLISQEKFRLDLYHRLAVIKLELPSLKERREDIPLLLQHFLNKYSKPNEEKQVSREVMDSLYNYDWPGNIRELENLVHRLVIMVSGTTIETENLNQWFQKDSIIPCNKIKVIDTDQTDSTIQSLNEFLDSAKKDHIMNALRMMGWNCTQASRKLGISRITLYKYLGEMKLEEITWDRV